MALPRTRGYALPALPARQQYIWMSADEPSGNMTLAELRQQVIEAEADGVPADAVVYQQFNVIRCEWVRVSDDEVTS